MIQPALLLVSAVMLLGMAWILFEITKRLCRGLKDLSEITKSMRSLPADQPSDGVTTTDKAV